MPKEQIRKRGRRKPKTEEEHAPVPPKVEAPTPTPTAPVPQQPQQAGPSGLHPDRLALLTGHGSRPSRPRVFDHGQPQTQPQQQIQPQRPAGAEGEEGAEKKEGEAQAEGDQPQGPWGRTFGLNEEFPFGELDPDTKGYFKGLDDKIKHWLETGSGTVTVGEEREGESFLLVGSGAQRANGRPTERLERRPR
jgi:nucleolar protein 9